jgi:pimeloyl-ACP methyl ester carboxylesterase
VEDLDIDSSGTRMGAWRLRARSDALVGPGGRPCVVMAHGFGATRDAGLLPFAEQFADAGADVVLFDYRGYGTSDTATGFPRQDVDHRRHREDYAAAITAVRALDGVDPDRLVLWGSSYSGGHVLPVAAADGRIAAVISLGAAVDGLGALLLMLRVSGVRHVARITGHALRDVVGSRLGRAAHHIPVVGEPGTLAAITAPDAATGYQVIMGPTFRNEMCARGVLRIALNRPVTTAPRVRCPLLVVVAERDNVANPSAVRKVAATSGGPVEVVELPSGHFDIYTGDAFDRSVRAQVQFLTRTLAPA